MWKIELPYKPGETVYVQICSHMGTWKVETCTVSHYLVRSETDIDITMRHGTRHGFRFCKPNEVFPTAEAAEEYIKVKQKEWDERK